MTFRSAVVLTFAVLTFSCAKQQHQIITSSQTQLVKGSLGKKVDSILTPYVKKLRELTNNQAGLAIGITKGDDIIYAKTFGYANISKSIEADFNTLFHIASVSKPFTAAAIVKLIDEQELSLDDLIVDHLPEFQMKGEAYKRISIGHILSHTSGIPRNISVGDWNNPVYGKLASKKTLADIKNFELDFEPGSKFSYSNSAFDLLGILISRVSGSSFETYVKKHILQQTGMTQSRYLKPKDSLPDNWAVPYSFGLKTQEWSPYPYSENLFPSSGLQTSLLNMCNWGILHVNKGSIKKDTVINRATFQLLYQPTYDTPWGDEIGLSWFLQSYLDRPIIMHQGNDTGFEAIMYVYPKEEISIVVMANRDFSRTARIINAASEVLFDQPIKDYQVSAKYPFADRFRAEGIDAARALWSGLKADTTDIYYVDYDDILTTGAVLENAENWQQTKEILQFYLTADSQSTYAWRLLGNAHLNLTDTIRAINCYRQALIINPDYTKAAKALAALKAQ